MISNTFKVQGPLDTAWTLEAFMALPGFGSNTAAPDDCNCPDVCVCGFDTRGVKEAHHAPS